MPELRVTHQGLIDATAWLFETVVCAAIFSFLASAAAGPLLEDGGWPSNLIGVFVWLLGALCATIDLRHRRRKRRELPLKSP